MQTSISMWAFRRIPFADYRFQSNEEPSLYELLLSRGIDRARGGRGGGVIKKTPLYFLNWITIHHLLICNIELFCIIAVSIWDVWTEMNPKNALTCEFKSLFTLHLFLEHFLAKRRSPVSVLMRWINRKISHIQLIRRLSHSELYICRFYLRLVCVHTHRLEQVFL